MNFNIKEIEKFSKKDSVIYPEYEKFISELVDFLDPLIDQVK